MQWKKEQKREFKASQDCIQDKMGRCRGVCITTTTSRQTFCTCFGFGTPWWMLLIIIICLFENGVYSFTTSTITTTTIPVGTAGRTTTTSFWRTTTTTTITKPSSTDTLSTQKQRLRTFGGTSVLHAGFSKTTTTTTTTATSPDPRTKTITNLMSWAKENGIKVGGVNIASTSPTSGLGLIANQSLSKGNVLMEVPTSMALIVDTPSSSFNLIEDLFKNGDVTVYQNSPWWVQMSLRLNAFDQGLMRQGQKSFSDTTSGIDMTPWLESLPRDFDTPFHWSSEQLEELQYPFLKGATLLQKQDFQKRYKSIIKALGPDSSFAQNLSYDKFVWGCECARSRAFSGSYTGSAFNPLPYALTLVLVVGYLLLNLGTVEQAANGAAVVFCANILKDFVAPKLFNKEKQRYVICPLIDMANHCSMGEQAQVAFEYFGNSYSLSSNTDVSSNKEVTISYGPRSNDQLLQYYGFIESNNPHDVYIMPPLREWNIERLEQACGRSFGNDRLVALEKAGLLGQALDVNASASNDDNAINRGGGVVVSRATGIDPAILQALRALVSTDEEWSQASKAVGSFAVEFSPENERAARLVAKKALQLELSEKSTTIQEDKDLLKSVTVKDDTNKRLAIQFRIEKKMLLEQIIKEI